MLQEMQIGLGRSRRAARAWASAARCPTCAPSPRAMVQADAFGIPIGQVLRVQSQRDAGQAPAAGRGGGPEGPGEDHDPADLLHPAVLFIAVHRTRGHRHDGCVRWRRSAELSQREQVAITSRVFCLAAILGLSAGGARRGIDPDGHRGRRRSAPCRRTSPTRIGRTTLVIADRGDRAGRPRHGADLPDVGRPDALPGRPPAARRAVPRTSRACCVTMLAQVASIVVVPLASSGFVDAGARAIDLAPWLLTNFGGGLLGVWARSLGHLARSRPTRTATTSPRASCSPSCAASPGGCRPAWTPTAWQPS